MSKEIILEQDGTNIFKRYDGDNYKVMLSADFYDKDEEKDVLVKVHLTFKRGIPKSWLDIIGEDYSDTVRMVLSAKSQQTQLD